jgi:hypothetical protein
MENRKDKWCIVKNVKQLDKTLPELKVIVLDTHCEVLEFESEEDANNMRDIFNINSDSGHKYETKKI